MCFECKDENNPQFDTIPMTEDARNYLKPLEEQRAKNRFEIIAQVGQGAMTPNQKSDFKVKIKIGDYEKTTGKPRQKDIKWCRYDEQFAQESIEYSDYASIEEMGTVFVYLLDYNNKIVSYWKGPA